MKVQGKFKNLAWIVLFIALLLISGVSAASLGDITGRISTKMVINAFILMATGFVVYFFLPFNKDDKGAKQYILYAIIVVASVLVAYKIGNVQLWQYKGLKTLFQKDVLVNALIIAVLLAVAAFAIPGIKSRFDNNVAQIFLVILIVTASLFASIQLDDEYDGTSKDVYLWEMKWFDRVKGLTIGLKEWEGEYYVETGSELGSWLQVTEDEKVKHTKEYCRDYIDEEGMLYTDEINPNQGVDMPTSSEGSPTGAKPTNCPLLRFPHLMVFLGASLVYLWVFKQFECFGDEKGATARWMLSITLGGLAARGGMSLDVFFGITYFIAITLLYRSFNKDGDNAAMAAAFAFGIVNTLANTTLVDMHFWRVTHDGQFITNFLYGYVFGWMLGGKAKEDSWWSKKKEELKGDAWRAVVNKLAEKGWARRLLGARKTQIKNRLPTAIEALIDEIRLYREKVAMFLDRWYTEFQDSITGYSEVSTMMDELQELIIVAGGKGLNQGKMYVGDRIEDRDKRVKDAERINQQIDSAMNDLSRIAEQRNQEETTRQTAETDFNNNVIDNDAYQTAEIYYKNQMDKFERQEEKARAKMEEMKKSLKDIAAVEKKWSELRERVLKATNMYAGGMRDRLDALFLNGIKVGERRFQVNPLKILQDVKDFKYSFQQNWKFGNAHFGYLGDDQVGENKPADVEDDEWRGTHVVGFEILKEEKAKQAKAHIKPSDADPAWDKRYIAERHDPGYIPVLKRIVYDPFQNRMKVLRSDSTTERITEEFVIMEKNSEGILVPITQERTINVVKVTREQLDAVEKAGIGVAKSYFPYKSMWGIQNFLKDRIGMEYDDMQEGDEVIKQLGLAKKVGSKVDKDKPAPTPTSTEE